MKGWLTLCLGLGVCLWLGSWVLSPLQMIPLTTPHIIVQWESHQTHSLWLLGNLAFWFSFSFISALYFAHCARGQNLIHLVLLTLSFPFILALVVYQYPSFFTLGLNPPLSHLILAALTVLSFYYLFQQLFTPSFLPQYIFHYLSPESTPKPRDHHFYLRKVIQFSIVVDYLLLPAGYPCLSFILLGMVIPGLLLMAWLGKQAITWCLRRPSPSQVALHTEKAE